MSKQEGTLDYRSDHYWVVDRPGQDDYELQAGDGIEVWTGMHWLITRIRSSTDSWRHLWNFQDKDGSMVEPHLGMRVLF